MAIRYITLAERLASSPILNRTLRMDEMDDKDPDSINKRKNQKNKDKKEETPKTKKVKIEGTGEYSKEEGKYIPAEYKETPVTDDAIKKDTPKKLSKADVYAIESEDACKKLTSQ